VWGSFDAYNIYNLQHFMTHPRIAYTPVGGWEHSNRAVCWIDSHTVAVVYNPCEEGDEGTVKDSPDEIHFYKMEGEEVECQRKIQLPRKGWLSAKLHFCDKRNVIFTNSEKMGFTAISLDGEVLIEVPELLGGAYDTRWDLYLKMEGSKACVYQIAP
jgi:hypothetical protein